MSHCKSLFFFLMVSVYVFGEPTVDFEKAIFNENYSILLVENMGTRSGAKILKDGSPVEPYEYDGSGVMEMSPFHGGITFKVLESFSGESDNWATVNVPFSSGTPKVNFDKIRKFIETGSRWIFVLRGINTTEDNASLWPEDIALYFRRYPKSFNQSTLFVLENLNTDVVSISNSGVNEVRVEKLIGLLRRLRESDSSNTEELNKILKSINGVVHGKKP